MAFWICNFNDTMKKISLLFILGILLIGVASSASYCCEKTASGAWCQNVNLKSECATGTNPVTGEPFKAVASLCEYTSYCKLGTCIDQQAGSCISSSYMVCEANGGLWSSLSIDKLSQCKLGCCLIGDQAAFVTNVGCTSLGDSYGLNVEYRADITNEIMCLASANPGAEGACVYTEGIVKTCERTTRKECQDREKTSQGDYSFHEGFLCSDPDLDTNCVTTQQTECKNDKVYFVDSCGNLANIYDSSKISDKDYWSIIQDSTCGDKEGNKDSAICGDCDYYYGSMCKSKETGDSVDYGNNLCKDLDCKDYLNKPYSGGVTKDTASGLKLSDSSHYPKHGETWCAEDKKTTGNNLPGSSYYRLMCYNGEVSYYECDSTRQEICLEDRTSLTGGSKFYYGACIVNKWTDCYAQTNKDDCTDDSRDCVWKTETGTYSEGKLGISSISYKNSGIYSFNGTGGLLVIDNSNKGVCVPKYSPGFERDERNSVIGGESCALASSQCNVKLDSCALFSMGVCDTPGVNSQGNIVVHIGTEKWLCDQSYPNSNCSCLLDNWADPLNNVCTAMGDCGVKVNFIGQNGKISSASQLVNKIIQS